MNVTLLWCRRQTVRLVACALAFSIAVTVSEAATGPLPNAPQPATAPAQTQNPTQNKTQNQTGSTAPSRTPGQYSSSQPVGTAAAPLIKPVGVAASRPAGAAIAPAKQRRIRVLAIRWGLIVGAAIAVGTVAAATMASPRRPN